MKKLLLALATTFLFTTGLRAQSECDTIDTFPWEEQFVSPTGTWRTCWQGASDWGYPSGGWGMMYYDDYDRGPFSSEQFIYAYDNELVLPAIIVPNVVNDNLSMLIEYFGGTLTAIVSPSGEAADTSFTDTVLTVTNSEQEIHIRVYAVPLSPYAGQTIRIKLIVEDNPSLSYINSIRIDHDTLPRIDVLSFPERVTTGESVSYSVSLRHGSTDGLGFTLHSSILDSTWVDNNFNFQFSIFNLIYPIGGTDTLTIIATNAYGSDTVHATVYVADCNPVTVFPWMDDFEEGILCWYLPEGSNWMWDATPSYYYPVNHAIGSRTRTDSVAQWIISKGLTLPNDDAQDLRLFWKAGGGSNRVHPYSVLVTTATDFTDTSNYTLLYLDTLPLLYYNYDFSVFTPRSASLAAYAGQTIHVAFRNESFFSNWDAVAIDNVEVRNSYAPVVTLPGLTMAMRNDSVHIQALLLEGSLNGLTYTWHSTLLDTTWVDGNFNFQFSVFNLIYPAAGTDTLTVTATNAYGTSTAMAVITVNTPPLPQVTLTAPTEVFLNDTATLIATLNDCDPTGLTYTWHSSLLDSTISTIGTIVNIAYPVAGDDTLTLVVSNIDGSDTAVAMIHVLNCNLATTPFFEDFEGVTATNATTAGSLPSCWDYHWNGSNAAYAPHVITTGGYQYMNDIPDNALFFVAGSSTGYGSTSIVYLPRFADSLQHLAMTLDYRFESSSRGILTVGWFDGNDVFHTVKNLTPHDGGYVRDTVLFTDQEAANYRIALWWEFGSAWYAAAVDNIEVFNPNTIIYPPDTVTVDSITTTTARVSWSPVPAATAYHIVVDGSPIDTTLHSTLYTLHLTGLSPSTTYTVSVAAIVGADTGRYRYATFTTACEVLTTFDMPFVEDFQSYSSTAYTFELPCWTLLAYSREQHLCVEPTSSGNNILGLWPDSNSTPHFAVMPAMQNIPALNMTFRTRGLVGSNLQVGVMTDPNDTLTFVPMAVFAESPTWDTVSVGFTTFTGSIGHIAFRGGMSPTMARLYIEIDDIVVTAQDPSCAQLVGLDVQNITPYTADLIITDTDAVGASYHIVVDGLPIDTTLLYPTSTLHLTGLSGTTNYTVTVRKRCSDSLAHMPVTTIFRTGCAPKTLPWNFGFEGLSSHYEATAANRFNPECWTVLNRRSANEPFVYDFDFSGHPTPHSGQRGLVGYCTSSPATVLVLPEFEGQPQEMVLGLWVYRGTASPYPYTHTYVSTGVEVGVVTDPDDASTFTLVATCAPSTVSAWVHFETTFPGITDGRLAIRYIPSQEAPLYLDDIKVEVLSDCLPPNSVTVTHVTDSSATITVNDLLNVGHYRLYLDGDSIDIVGHTYTLTGLTPSTDYTLGVSTLCADSSVTTAVTRTFHTPCVATPLPWSEDFDNLPVAGSYTASTLPCWDHLGSGIVRVHSTHELNFYALSTERPNIAILPNFEQEIASLRLSIELRCDPYVATGTENNPQFNIGYLTDPADSTTFVAVATYTPAFCRSGNSYVLMPDTVTFVGAPAGSRIALRHNENLYSFPDWFVDNLYVLVDSNYVPPAPDTVWRTVTVTANVEGACEIYGSGIYADSSVVEIGYRMLDTLADGGYWQYLGWSDGETGNPRQIVVTSDTILTALFQWMADTVGIEEISIFNFQFSIYPNPSHGDVTISRQDVGGLAEVTVLDLTGRVVIPPTPINTDLLLSTSDLSSGTYFVRVISDSGIFVKKLIIK